MEIGDESSISSKNMHKSKNAKRRMMDDISKQLI